MEAIAGIRNFSLVLRRCGFASYQLDSRITGDVHHQYITRVRSQNMPKSTTYIWNTRTYLLSLYREGIWRLRAVRQPCRDQSGVGMYSIQFAAVGAPLIRAHYVSNIQLCSNAFFKNKRGSVLLHGELVLLRRKSVVVCSNAGPICY